MMGEWALEPLGRISRRSGVTRYHQLYTYLRRALLEGAIGPGSALPSEAQLTRQYQLSRSTVRRALGALEKERLIVRRRGSGSYARKTGTSGEAPEGMAHLARDLKRLEAKTTVRIIQFGVVATPGHVLRRCPEFSRRSLLIYRTRYHEGECVAVHTSYVHERVAAGLTRARLGRRTVPVALAALGHTPRTGTQTISAAAADVIVARHLDIPDGSPVLRIEGLTNSEQLPLEYYVYVFRADRLQIEASVLIERSASGQPCEVIARHPLLPA